MCPSLERPTPSNSRALSQRSCRHPSRESAPQRAAASSQQVEHPQPRCGPPALLRGASSAPPSLSLSLSLSLSPTRSLSQRERQHSNLSLAGWPPPFSSLHAVGARLGRLQLRILGHARTFVHHHHHGWVLSRTTVADKLPSAILAASCFAAFLLLCA